MVNSKHFAGDGRGDVAGALDAIPADRIPGGNVMERSQLVGSIVRTALALVAASLLAATTGCVHVAPYERGTLAHPTMSAEDPYTTPLAAHVQDVSEGAIGGLSGGGGGCGCN
jgi:hypothetical protein